MITLCYFASLRDALGVGRETFELPEHVNTIAELIGYLGAERGDRWRLALTNKLISTALNQEVCSRDSRIAVGDEIAFFPPVTGG